MAITLNTLLDDLEIEVAPFAVRELRDGAALTLSREKAARLHYVLRGHAVAHPAGGPSVSLRPHMVVITPCADFFVQSGLHFTGSDQNKV